MNLPGPNPGFVAPSDQPPLLESSSILHLCFDLWSTALYPELKRMVDLYYLLVIALAICIGSSVAVFDPPIGRLEESRPRPTRRQLSTKHQAEGIQRRLSDMNETSVNHVVAESRIVGGVDAARGAYPFFVHGRGCGASLVARDVALTAAHCNTPGVFADVVVGPYLSGSMTGAAVQRSVDYSVPHPNYNPVTQDLDLMLLKLSSPVDTVEPIAFNKAVYEPASGDSLTVIGFGALEEGGSSSSRLQEVEVEAFSHSTCNDLYSGDINEKTMLCAGEAGGGQDSCQGDSGGPIFSLNPLLQIGVVSWGIGCARSGYPGVYARTSGAADWIESTICDLSSDPPAYCNRPVEEAPPLEEIIESISSADADVTIAVTHDLYPTETGWSLISDADGRVVASQDAGAFTEENGTSVITVRISPGPYTFSISDSFGDGACCSYGQGSIEISSNGVTLLSVEARFRRQGFASVNIPEETTVPASTDPNLVYRIDIQFDEYPDDLEVTVKDAESGNVLFVSPAKSGYQPFALLTGDVVGMLPGKEYELLMEDSYGDGICCEHGSGYVQVYSVDAETEATVEVLLYNAGNFSSESLERFLTPPV